MKEKREKKSFCQFEEKSDLHNLKVMYKVGVGEHQRVIYMQITGRRAQQ